MILLIYEGFVVDVGRVGRDKNNFFIFEVKKKGSECVFFLDR